jgi:transposase InsO family protein
MSGCHGRLPNTKGKESKDKQYTGGTIFVDHASGYMYVANQISLRTGETLQAKSKFEAFAKQSGVKVKHYHADNAPFSSKEFQDDLDANGQTMSFSGVGAHHQNGVAENAIRTVTRWARAMLLHSIIHWPEQADPKLWPFALDYAVYLWNSMPQRDNLQAPIELFASTKFDSYEHLQRAHVWGAPAYVLEPKLQDGKKVKNGTREQSEACFSVSHLDIRLESA